MAAQENKQKFVTLKYGKHEIKCRVGKINKRILQKWQLKSNEYILLLNNITIEPNDFVTLIKTLSNTPLPKSGCIVINVKKIPVNINEESKHSSIAIFKQPQKHSYLTRLSVGLKYYQILIKDNADNIQTEVSKELLVNFGMEIYTNFLNDYINFIQHMDNEQLLQFEHDLNTKYGLQSCDIATCHRLQRHYGKRVQNKDNDNHDEYYDFYCNCFERLHHQIFHLFSMGLRTESISIKQNYEDDNFDFVCVDKLFKEKRDLITLRRKQCAFIINRYNEQNNKYNNAFNIAIANKIGLKQTETSCEDMTFLDEMYQFIRKNENIEEYEVKELQVYISLYEYDSDVVKYELDDILNQNETASGIYKHIQNKLCIEMMIRYLRNIQLSATSFSTGYTFYYWDYYKCLIEEKVQQIDKIYKHNQHHGQSIRNLLITQHFASLKIEILSSGFVSIKQWNQKIVFDANEYKETDTVKNIKCKYTNYHNIYCKIDEYGYVQMSSSISLSHLICIILYCGWSDLCTHFSATFRKSHQFESLYSLRLRHSKYYHFSKGLVEAVKDFGSYGYEYPKKEFAFFPDYLISDTPEKGPFFCGISFIPNIPSFAMYLQGPCSTTKNIEIAINFATRNGIIMELQNDGIMSEQQRFFDCSWISTFAEENERLFCAGNYRIRIVSIRIIESAKNYQDFFHAFYVFDQMLSGDEVERDVNISSADVLILDTLINSKLHIDNENVNKMDKYIINTFDFFLIRKTQIDINTTYLKYFKRINHFIIHKTTGKQNVLNTKILSIFSNLNQVVIDTTDIMGEDVCKFDLLSFLSSINSFKSSINYVIKATPSEYGEKNKTWLKGIVTKQIKNLFNEKKWMINTSTNTDSSMISIVKKK